MTQAPVSLDPAGVAPAELSPAQIRQRLAPFRRASAAAATWQLLSTFAAFITLGVAMWFALHVGWWLSMLIALPTAGMMVRLFIFQHDCGHGSFYRSNAANRWVGTALSLFTLTPYEDWRADHALHHASSGDLDHRGDGDVHTLTVDEYNRLSPRRKLGYRLYRHPLVMFGLFPTLLFFVQFRSTRHIPRTATRQRRSVWITNIGLAAIATGGSLLIGPGTFFALYLPMAIIAATIGVWMFFVQHQFDPTYWQRHEQWNRVHASLQGSSYYRLPAVLRWFTGNIGLHHIHHLDSRIPNYRLQRCLQANRDLLDVPPLTVRASFRCARLKLWDEKTQRMVGFSAAAAAGA